MIPICAVIILLVLLAAPARAMEAEKLAKSVGQKFAGYQDFWVWVTQRFTDSKGKTAEYKGRVYFKRDKMFRLNFGQPPFLIHGTDGDKYWIYDKDKNVIYEYTHLDAGAPVHMLFQVFAAGEQMVTALDKFFNVDALEEAQYTDKKTGEKIPTYKLVISLKPERLKEIREKEGNKLIDPDAKQRWTFWVDQKTFLPRQVQIDWETKDKYIFELEEFYPDRGLNDNLFRMPRPDGVKIEKMKGGGK